MLKFTLYFTLASLPLLTTPSCGEKDQPDPTIVDTDCRYKFAQNIDDIYGAWEPKQVINLVTGDTTNFAPGKGHTGFIFDSSIYADAFELRPDSTLALYYVQSGRFCKTRNDGKWYYSQDTIYFPQNKNKLHVLSITDSELVMEDVVNFSLSKATYRKSN